MPVDLSGLLSFIRREGDWAERLQEVVDEHIDPILDQFDIAHEDLIDIVGEQFGATLWGCGFEDFLGQHYEDGNIVDLYLKRRGWKETVLNRAYFAGLRDTPVSLYEVSEVQPGVSMRLRDLLSDAAPVTVNEKSATRTLRQWDRITARVVPERDRHVISGAVLPYSADAEECLLIGLRDALKLKKRDPVRLSQAQLKCCGPIFTAAWLYVKIEAALDPVDQQLVNSDGDDVLFHDLRFPLLSGVTQKAVAARLDKIKGFTPEGAKFWNWVAARKGGSGKAGSGMMIETRMAGATVLGSAELKGKTLLVSVNSAKRAAKVQALIIKAAGDLLKSPLVMIQTPEQLQAARRKEGAGTEVEEIPAEIAQQIMRDHLDKHYRETLDTPIMALGGKSPRQSIGTAAGRDKVVNWLKMLENGSQKSESGLIAEYDFGWMWVELGLQDFRR